MTCQRVRLACVFETNFLVSFLFFSFYVQFFKISFFLTFLKYKYTFTILPTKSFQQKSFSLQKKKKKKKPCLLSFERTTKF